MVWFVQCPLSEVCLQNELLIRYGVHRKRNSSKSNYDFLSIHFCTRAPGRGDGVRNTRWYTLVLITLSLSLYGVLRTLSTYYSLLQSTTVYYSLLGTETERPSHAWPVSFVSALAAGGQMFHAELVPLLCTPAFRVRNATLHTWYITEYSVLGQSILLIYIEDDSFLLWQSGGNVDQISIQCAQHGLPLQGIHIHIHILDTISCLAILYLFWFTSYRV